MNIHGPQGWAWWRCNLNRGRPLADGVKIGSWHSSYFIFRIHEGKCVAGLFRRICLHCVLLSRFRYSIFLDRPGDSHVRRNEVDDLYLQKIEVFLFLLKKFCPHWYWCWLYFPLLFPQEAYIIDYMDASTGCMIVHLLRVVRKLIDQLESLEKYRRWVRRCLSLRGSPPQILLSGNLRMEDMHIQDRVLEKGDGVFSVCLLVWGCPLGWKKEGHMEDHVVYHHAMT